MSASPDVDVESSRARAGGTGEGVGRNADRAAHPAARRLVQVAVPSPLYGLFDYVWDHPDAPLPGVRVRVPFGRRHVGGVLVAEIGASDVPEGRLRKVGRVLDAAPVLPPELLSLLLWASRYYHHPVGEVLAGALPVLLRRGAEARITRRETYRLVASDTPLDPAALAPRAPLQRALLARLLESEGAAVDSSVLAGVSARWRVSMRPLLARGLVALEESESIPSNRAVAEGPEPFDEQAHAVTRIVASLGGFRPFLLHGVTGSGKTEVYLRAIREAVGRGLQTLVLVPEISLTPQLMRRFEARLDGCLVTLHSGLNDTERLQNWLLAADGHADVIIGTRSAVLVPLPRLGLVVVDEEHDGSLKQQDGFRYHARDLALMRARSHACPVVLGTATPALETLHNVRTGRYEELPLARRAGDAVPPTLALLDVRRRALVEGMSDRLLDAIARHLGEGGQAMVFVNRRGFAPTLLCNDCGAAADCARCDAHMTVHARSDRLRCHHCGAERAMPAACESCGSLRLDRVGYGTERITDALEAAFPDVRVARIDRDSTRRKGALERQLELATSGAARLLVGTQMLAKGHHFPKLTLVGVLDADRGLFGTDFRSLEHMGQLVVQVAGRAGREATRGTVLIQTRNPDNEMLGKLVHEGYAAFADALLDARRAAELPPYAFVALIRSEASEAAAGLDFLGHVATRLARDTRGSLQILGPVPAPMERLGGRYRAQLFLQSDSRATLNDRLLELTTRIGELPGARHVRWSIDVDPVDLY